MTTTGFPEYAHHTSTLDDQVVGMVARGEHFYDVARLIDGGEPCPHCCGAFGQPGKIVEVSAAKPWRIEENPLNCEHCGAVVPQA